MIYAGIIVIALIGTLSHFLYELSGHNKFMAIFAAVNESTWEHIKIALNPSLLWGLYDGFIYGQSSNYFPAKTLSLLTIILVIPTIFYTYKAILKRAILAVDIIIFYISIICSQLVFMHIINLPPMEFMCEYFGTIGLFIIFGLCMILTLQPFEIFLFKDPISHKYGLSGHTEFGKHKHTH